MFSLSNRIRHQRHLKSQHSVVIEVPLPSPPVLPKSKRHLVTKPKMSLPVLGISSSVNKPTISWSHASALAQAKNRLELTLSHSHAPKTSKNYDYAVLHYIKFAASIGYAEGNALPASKELILLWVCEGLGKTGPGTAKQNLSALHAWHIKHRLPWHCPECIPFIARALKEFWPHESKKPVICPPITSTMISMLVKAWQGGSPRRFVHLPSLWWPGVANADSASCCRNHKTPSTPNISLTVATGLVLFLQILTVQSCNYHGQRPPISMATPSSSFASIIPSMPQSHFLITSLSHC